MPLVGFTTEIYYNARPYERQTQHKGNNNNKKKKKKKKKTLHTRQSSRQCRVNAAVSPDDGHTVTRNI